VKNYQTDFNKAICFISASLDKVSEMTKPQRKFVLWVVEKWSMLPFRYNFSNLYRSSNGSYCEKSIRHQFSRKIDFPKWFDAAFESLRQKDCISVFDPTYITKSGKKTFGKGYFWSGKDQRIKPGLEVGCLAIVDIADGAAYSVEAVQTPAHRLDKLMDHYVSIIARNAPLISAYSKWLVVDGYFMKKSFIDPVLSMNLDVITRMRPDANLQYIYSGVQKQGRGRKRTNGGKVDVKKIDKRRWKKCYDDDLVTGYEIIVKSVTLKKTVKVVYLQNKANEGYTVLLSTDTSLPGNKIIQYYSMRYQIEFLIRDAKQHTGLEDCQAISQAKLYNHFNLSLMTVSLMRLSFWAKLPDKHDFPFSMRSIKNWFYNKYLTETIFSNLGLQLNCNKIKKIYAQCLNIGSMAA